MSRRIRRSADKKTGRVVSRKTRRHFLRSCGLSAVAEGVQRDSEARSARERPDMGVGPSFPAEEPYKRSSCDVKNQRPGF